MASAEAWRFGERDRRRRRRAPPHSVRARSGRRRDERLALFGQAARRKSRAPDRGVSSSVATSLPAKARAVGTFVRLIGHTIVIVRQTGEDRANFRLCGLGRY